MADTFSDYGAMGGASRGSPSLAWRVLGQEPSQECLSRKWYVLSTHSPTAPLHPTPTTKIQNQSISLRKTQGPSLHLLVLGAGWAPVLQLGQHRELKAGVEGRGSGETSVGWLCGSRPKQQRLAVGRA